MYRVSLEVQRNAEGPEVGLPEGSERKDRVVEPPKTISSVTDNYLSRCLDGQFQTDRLSDGDECRQARIAICR